MDNHIAVVVAVLACLISAHGAPYPGGIFQSMTSSASDGNVIATQVESSGPQLPPFDNRCCKIGRRAARQGYSCEVNIAILQGRLNMPHRYKMKFEGKTGKTGFDFARKFNQCSKSLKHKDQFYRCCNKSAARMDGV